MSKARELAELGAVYDSGALSNRNMVINGAMQVNQRGDQTGLSSSSTYGIDRFRLTLFSHGTFSISQSSTAPDGFTSSFKVDCTTADTSLAAGAYVICQHRLEAQNLQHLNYGSSSAKKVTLSFHVRSNVTGTYALNVYAADSDKQITKNYTINSADTWEKKEITIDALTDGSGITNDNGLGIELSWFLAAGSTYTGSSQTTWNTYTGNENDYARGQAADLASSTSNEWYITGVQMELGTEATPFEHRSFGEELHKCQRYFEVIVSGDSKEIGGGNYYSSSSIHCPTIFETSKRTNSYSVTVTGGSNYFRVYRNGSSDDFNGFTGATRANINRCLLYAQSGVSGSAGHGLELLTNNASAKIVIDDEL